ncbi:MAG: phosphotransferase [Planctomycetota bacterium]|nr:phosphotransferase [Planctomycetota bacterium]
MTPAVRALMTDAVHREIAAVVGVAPDDLTKLGGFESFVFETVVDDEARIVKATWSGRRTPEEIGAEADFLRYAAERGAQVCGATPLASGAMVATVPAGDDAFHVYAQRKALGAMVPATAWEPEHFERCGRMLGALHRIATAYPGPPAPLWRKRWEAEYGELEPIIAAEPDLHARYREVVDAIASLPRDTGAFGSMHCDPHSHNMFWHDGEPRLFDFEDMCPFWFISDLAMVLFYAVLNLAPEVRTPRFQQAYADLLRGYAPEHALPSWSYEALPLFLSLREHVLRAVVIRSVPREEQGAWWHAYIDDCAARWRDGRPPLDLEL